MVLDLFLKQLRSDDLCSPLECSSDNVPDVFFAQETIASMEFRKICKFLKSVRKNSINCYSGHVEYNFDNPANFFCQSPEIQRSNVKKSALKWGEINWYPPKEKFLQPAHPGIQDASSKNMSIGTSRTPEVFFPNLNVLGTKICFPGLVFTSICSSRHVEWTFLSLPIFFLSFEVFNQCPKKSEIKWFFFQKFHALKLVLCLWRMQFGEYWRYFLPKSRKFWFKFRWIAAIFEQKFFAKGEFSSYCSIGHVKHVKCSFVEHADLFCQKTPLSVRNVQNYLKPIDFFWKVLSSNCVSVYVEGSVNCAVENFSPKIRKLSTHFPTLIECWKVCSTKKFPQIARLSLKKAVLTLFSNLYCAKNTFDWSLKKVKIIQNCGKAFQAFIFFKLLIRELRVNFQQRCQCNICLPKTWNLSRKMWSR